jgi:sugar lactone lactonase YvrE
MRFNDGKVSPHGAFIVGRMHSKWRTGGACRGRLYLLRWDSDVLSELLSPEQVWLPNGMDWDQTKGVMYYVDSGEESITEYKTDADGCIAKGPDGTPSHSRVLSKVDTGHKYVPDGMCLDADGNLWVAYGESGEVTCIDPGSGHVLKRVGLPVKRPTACTFGGPGERRETCYTIKSSC